jgi:hypothetical protein
MVATVLEGMITYSREHAASLQILGLVSASHPVLLNLSRSASLVAGTEKLAQDFEICFRECY